MPYGAFAGQALIGYVLGWAGVDPHEGLHLHSHMLATLPDRRHRGVGYALKLAQRAQGLEQGISVGAVDLRSPRGAQRVLQPPQAGRRRRSLRAELLRRDDRRAESWASAPIGSSIRWDLEREPGPRPFETAPPSVIDEAWNFSGLPPEAERGVLVRVPADLLELRGQNPELAARCRDAVAEAIEAGMAAGLVAVGFLRDEGVSGYVMARDPAR